MSKITHALRVWIFGKCPKCGGSNISGVFGWGKERCRDCGHVWTDVG
jgi:uncharacterized protein (DUF983 family)